MRISATLPVEFSRQAPRLLAVAIATFLVALVCLAFTREVGRVAAVWPVNAIIVVALLRAPRRSWPSIIAAGITGIIAADRASGDPWLSALVLSSCNVVEIALCAALLHWRAGSLVDLSERRNLVVFL